MENNFEFDRKLDLKLILSIMSTALLALMGIIVETSMNVSFPTLMSEFDISTDIVQWCTTGYLLALAIMIPSSAFLRETVKMKTLFISANLLFISGTLLCMLAPAFVFLLIGRVIQAIGTGIALPLMYNIVLEQAPLEKMGFITGIASLIPGLGPAVGPFVGGLIMKYFGWRMVFAFLLPILVLSLFAGIYAIRQSSTLKVRACRANRMPEENVLAANIAKLDIPGYLFLGVFLVCLILGINNAGTLGFSSPVTILFIVGGVIFLILFIMHAKKCDAPIINLKIFKYKRFVLSLLSIMMFFMIALGIGLVLPSFGQISLGLDTLQAGVLLIFGCIVGAVFNPLSGRSYDKNGAVVIMHFSSICVLAALALYLLTLNNTSTLLMTVIYIPFGFAMGCTIGVMITNGLKALPEDLKPFGNATITTLQQIASAIGTVLASSIMAAEQAKLPDDPAAGTLNGARYVFILFLCMAAILFFDNHFAIKKEKESTRRG